MAEAFLSQAADRFQQILSLIGYVPNTWTHEHTALMADFLTGTGRKRLFAFIESGILQLVTSLPVTFPGEFMYFIIDLKSDMDMHVLLDEIQYGKVNKGVLESLLRQMQGIYVPNLTAQTNWPQNVHMDFLGQLQKFMTTLTESTYHFQGRTVLYVPIEEYGDPAHEATNKENVQRLESLVVQWTKQIKEVIHSQGTFDSAEKPTPLDEIQFWHSRCDDLSGISKQLQDPKLGHILSILEFAKSPYLDQFSKISNLIRDGSQEASDNLNFLSILSDPCRSINDASPKTIIAIIPRVLHCVRFIWSKSRFYNTKEKITSLLRKVSNQIIIQCASRIQLEQIFFGDVCASILTLKENIECGEEWKRIYEDMSVHIRKHETGDWHFDDSSIFAQLDAFVQRCRDLLEVSESQLQFARKTLGGEKMPIPVFGGPKGNELIKGLEDIEKSFEKLLMKLWGIKDYILDVKETHWHDEYGLFKQAIKDLEVMMQNIVQLAMEDKGMLTRSLEMLEIFHSLAKREAIRRTVEKKASEVWARLIDELKLVKEEFETNRKAPAILRTQPDYAGSAYWAKSLLKRISFSMDAFKNATFLPQTAIADDAKALYDSLAANLDEYITKTHHDWINICQISLKEKLDQPLMVKNGTILNINYDKDLARIFAEINYFQKLKCDVPFHLLDIYRRKDDLRHLRDNLLLIVRDYNNIFEILTRDQQFLLRERIRVLERKLKPALSKLNWGSKTVSDLFVKECRKHSSDLQKVVNEFLYAYKNIMNACQDISSNILWHIENQKIYELSEFENFQNDYRISMGAAIQKTHEVMGKQIQTIYDFIKNDGKEIQEQWGVFLRQVDQVVLDSIMESIKKSLQSLSRSINGDGKVGDSSVDVQPIININVVLENQKLDFSPSLPALDSTINKVASSMTEILSSITPFSVQFLNEPYDPEETLEAISNDEEIKKLLGSLQSGVTANATKCHQYLRSWDSYKELWEINKDAFIRRYAKLKPALSTFDADINRYSEVANNIQKEETLVAVNFISLDCSPLKQALVSHCNVWQNKLTTLLNNNARADLNGLHDMISTNTVKLKTRPQNPEQLAELINLVGKINQNIPNVTAQFEPLAEEYQILEKYEVQVSEHEKTLMANLPGSWSAFRQTITDCNVVLEECKAQFRAELVQQSDEFHIQAVAFKDEFSAKGPYNFDMGLEKAMASIERYEEQLTQFLSQQKALTKGLSIFNIESATAKDFEFVTGEIALLKQVWSLVREWEDIWGAQKLKHFLSVDADALDESVNNFLKRANKMPKEVMSWDVYVSIKNLLNHIKRSIPLFKDLKNPALRERHWSMVMEEIGRQFDPKSTLFTPVFVLELGLDKYVDFIATLSASASKELIVEIGLSEIRDRWADMAFEIVPYKEDKGYLKFRGADVLFEALEENQVGISSMKSSKFSKPFMEELDKWEKELSVVSEVIDILLMVQRQWMYLENIFIGAEDIRKQLPMEAKLFDDINLQWSSITNYLLDERIIITCLKRRNLLKELTEMNTALEKIQKSLDLYLETKRQAFPRFYFISNDDLLEILGQAKDPNLVQPHFRKCFDNIYRLEIASAGSDSNKHYEGLAMASSDGEVVKFSGPVLLEGPVEFWMTDIETKMRETLKSILPDCLNASRKSKRDRWLRDWPGQLLITCGLISWTMDCTKALQEVEKGDKMALRLLKKKQMSNLKKLADLVSEPLSKVDRKKLTALITVEVHSRDVIERMVKAECGNVNAFEWLSQLRFYWEGDREEECYIRQINTQFKYGYEYLGNSGRLVITPLTDRCYMTLTTALNLFRGGSPQGPAGTGKTETVKDLGKSLGKFVIVQNCSEALDYKSMGRMFSGVAQTGAWGCFDEFNRIDIEVLSVVALQIQSILNAVARKAKTFIFEGQEIKLDTTCGIFITMNPGYAGRTELPDNLKALFRPVAMMVPDSALIAEIMLFSEGFSNTRALAKKVDTLYRLAGQQLSKQDHYDFNLRALTSALRTGGSKKRQNPSFSDEVVIFLAIRDNNIPKLTADDVPLFNAIMSDLFPGVETPTIDYGTFKNCLGQEVQEMNLQSIDGINQKVVQLYETKLSRHGVMIVGDSCVAKSTVWKLLQGTLTRLSKEEPDKYSSVRTFIINPKSVSLGELYGEYDVSTNEWKDGILSSVMRTACSDEKTDQKWIVFDGPVDTLWIESMNTVLDDNKILTLINGERIAMPEQVSLLFEVESLSTASPATVSRAGMIYMDYKNLGWRPYVDSWLEKKQSQALLRPLVTKFFERLLEVRRLKCQELVSVLELAIVRSFCRLYDALDHPQQRGTNHENGDNEGQITEMWFMFSLIWSFGASLTEESRKIFDITMRDLDGRFPSKGTVFDYMVDSESLQWVPWEEKLNSNWKYNPSLPKHKIYIPTVDTLRNEYVIQALLNSQQHVMIVGEVGTGKTSLVRSILSTFNGVKNTVKISMSAKTSSNTVQSIIESQVEKRTKNIYVPIGGKGLIAFIDDFNMPMKDTFGSQPPLELLRNWLDYGFFYDRQRQTMKFVNDVLMITAMGPPGGGRNHISQRISSRFNLINVTFPSPVSLMRMYGTLMNQKLMTFEDDLKVIGEALVQSLIDLYFSVSARFLPTPTKIHYTFNLRDISKVIYGLLRADSDYYDAKESLLRLWAHETCRVFQDRLVDNQDRDAFFKILDEKCFSSFQLSTKQIFQGKKHVLFSDIAVKESEKSIYKDVEDLPGFKSFLESKLEEYNTEGKNSQMKLVLFGDAMDHICRIARVLGEGNGNVLLLGTGGSGRQSLTRLAAYLLNIFVFQIKISKNYRHSDFREDLKSVLKICGVENRKVAFLLTDQHIVSDTFLEDVSNFLSTGEVPNLYTQDEMAEIKQAVAAPLLPSGEDPSWTVYGDRTRENLHIVLCMSPGSQTFRDRLMMFPAIVNNCTIDFFSDWPEDALEEVAIKYLQDTADLDASTKKSIANMFVTVHSSVREQSHRMLLELKRYNFVTPINYLELVTGYQSLLSEKRSDIGQAAFKLKNGLQKLDDTRKSVEKISKELEVAKQQVSQFQKQCEDYLVVIVQQKREADEQAKSVAAKAEKLGVEEEEVRAVADAAQADLDQAMPALNMAVKALEAINKKDLNEIRSYGKPPPLVEKVMEAIMVLKKSEPTWDEAKRQLGNPNFIKQLIGFDKDNISDKILKRISQYCSDENFQPDVVGRVSGAAKSLCMWVRAMETYGNIYRQVLPKKEKLKSAQDQLEKKQSSLKEAKSKLQEIQDKLAQLKSQYEEKVELKEKLRKDSEEMEIKLQRAEQLVSGLSGEKTRWEQSIKDYEEALVLLPGNCLLASAFLSYAGPFNSTYRNYLIQEIWLNQIRQLDIPFSESFQFVTFLGKPTDIQEWNLQGLPGDAFSAENGIIVARGRRSPLMIDPQGQANKWIKNMENERGLKIVDLKQADFLRVLELSIQYGTPVLLQGVYETLDPVLDPIISRSVVKKAGLLSIKLGDKEIEFNSTFKLYLTTKLPNPKYEPEMFAKASIVNFSVKEEGLEDQLLGIVVKKEKPDLEEQKSALVRNVASARKKLLELEDEILYLLSNAQGSLLDDAKLVNTLQSSKSISEEVGKQLRTSQETEKKIDLAREGYRPSSQRASVLYFVLNEMSAIDPMYQFSLDSYIDLFEKSIMGSKRTEDLNERISQLNEYHTYAVYKYISRALFERHKLLFCFQMTVKILESNGKLNKTEYDFLLHGGQVLDKDNQLPNPFSEWMEETVWDVLTELDKMASFTGLISSLEQNEKEWKGWFMSQEPETVPLPSDWENKLSLLQRMLLVKAFRPDRLLFCIQNFVATHIGRKYVEPPILDISSIVADSSPKTPLIFVLSSGVDPMSQLTQIAAKHGMSERFQYLSLGQGQAPKATRMIADGLRDGNWVFLANCHLSISWMPTLEKIIESIPTEKPHAEFRLWLSSSPHPKFPISILQSGIKMTTEPPKGLKANMTRLYANVTPTSFSKSVKPTIYQKLFFSLCFFHSLLLERKKFLTMGWNIAADFNDSDFEVCENLLVVLLNEYEAVPWDSMKYLIAEAHYGGRVTDDWDRRILRSYINHLFCEEAVTQPGYKFSELPTYCIPQPNEFFTFRDFIANLPNYDRPEAFGQHPNADIASQINESNALLESLLSLQPQNVSVGGMSREAKIMAIAVDLVKKIPQDIDYDNAYNLVKHDLYNPFNVVVLQEVKRYNILLSEIRRELEDLQKGIQGFLIMTAGLEEVATCVFEGRVPPSWKKAYLSLKPLAGWMRDLNNRIEFFNEWAKGGEPKSFWLGAFTFPTGFLTAVLQKAARKNNVPVDALSFEFNIASSDGEALSPAIAKEGVFIHGLYLEGAGWDSKTACLKEPNPMELTYLLPPIHFRPVEGKKKSARGTYVCPVYYYPLRGGSRERPSFITSVELKSGAKDSDFYVKRGTAILTSLP